MTEPPEVEAVLELRGPKAGAAAPLRAGLQPAVDVVLAVGDEVAAGDEARLTQAVADAVGDRTLDLVIDDGTHQYRDARTAFEVCFPLLRSGGRYWLTDWAWAHAADADPADDRPALTNLVVELVAVAGTDPGLVREVTVRHAVIEVVRGDAPLPVPFRLAHAYRNRGIRFRPVL